MNIHGFLKSVSKNLTKANPTWLKAPPLPLYITYVTLQSIYKTSDLVSIQSMYNAGRQKGTLLAQRRKRLLQYIQKHSDAVLLFCFLHFRWETNTKHNWLSYKLKHCTVQNILWIVLVKNIYIYNADLFLKYTQRHRHTLTGRWTCPSESIIPVGVWSSAANQQLLWFETSPCYSIQVYWNSGSGGMCSDMVGCRLTSFRLNWSTLQLRPAFLFFDPSPDSAAHLFLQCSENTRWNSAQDWATCLKLHPSPSATTKPTRFVNWMTYFLLAFCLLNSLEVFDKRLLK